MAGGSSAQWQARAAGRVGATGHHQKQQIPRVRGGPLSPLVLALRSHTHKRRRWRCVSFSSLLSLTDSIRTRRVLRLPTLRSIAPAAHCVLCAALHQCCPLLSLSPRTAAHNRKVNNRDNSGTLGIHIPARLCRLPTIRRAPSPRGRLRHQVHHIRLRVMHSTPK